MKKKKTRQKAIEEKNLAPKNQTLLNFLKVKSLKNLN